jgi:hypothetical protein
VPHGYRRHERCEQTADQARKAHAEHEQREHDEDPIRKPDGSLRAHTLAERGEGSGHQPGASRAVERQEIAVRNRALEHTRAVRDDGSLVHLGPATGRVRGEVRAGEDAHEQRARDRGDLVAHRLAAGFSMRAASGGPASMLARR